MLYLFFFFNASATSEIYTLSLHDALPITRPPATIGTPAIDWIPLAHRIGRSEEHTSELQSHSDLVCRLLLEKKKIRIELVSCDLNSAALHPLSYYHSPRH